MHFIARLFHVNAVRYVEELISKEAEAGIPSDRVVVAGFSQGGAIALLMLRSHLKLAGVVGESMHCVPLLV
jgi:predicted esterase